MKFIGFLTFFVFLGSIIASFFQILKALINFFFRHHINRYLLIKKLQPMYRVELETHSNFYKRLNSKEKTLFEKRVQKFINMKEFFARGELTEITPKIKALISAAAIQLTFGYPGIYFLHFWKILVYENDYYSRITNQYHQGEVNTRGFIVISWQSFLIGINNPTSGRNLGLHEMAHALRLENAVRNHEYDFIDFNHLLKFEELAREEIYQINNAQSIFRSYAGSNTHELFAIAVELFFERPEEFRNYNPFLFRNIENLLNQRSRHDDTSLKKTG